MGEVKWKKTVNSIKDLLSSLSCSICNATLTKPSTVGRCSHIYCHACIMNLCQVSKDTSCPDCNEPFWLKDIHVDHEIEQIITLCQDMLPRFYKSLTTESCKILPVTADTSHKSIQEAELPDDRDPESKSAMLHTSPRPSKEDGNLTTPTHAGGCQNENFDIASPTLDSYLNKLDSSNDFFTNMPIETVELQDFTNQEVIGEKPDVAEGLSNASKVNNVEPDNVPGNVAEGLSNASKVNNVEPDNVPGNDPLYHTPPDKDEPDSYETACNESPDHDHNIVKDEPALLEVISGQTIDLCPSSIAVIDITDSGEPGLSMFDEKPGDVFDDSENSAILSKLTSRQQPEISSSGLNISTYKEKDVFCNVSLPTTPKEVSSQKSQHVKHVVKTFQGRGKRRHVNNLSVHNWLHDSKDMSVPLLKEHDKRKKSVSNESDDGKVFKRSYKLRSNKMDCKEVIDVEDNIAGIEMPTETVNTQEQSRSVKRRKTSSANSTDILKTPLQKMKPVIKLLTTPVQKRSKVPKLDKTPKTPSAPSQYSTMKTPTSTPRNKRNQKGETPLHRAAIAGNEEKLRNLLLEGEDPNVCDHFGWTPLHETCIHKHVACAKLLLEFHAPVSVRAKNHDTPLHDACAKNCTEIVKLLLDHGACKAARNIDGYTPADYACSAEVLEMLEKAPASQNIFEEEEQLLGRNEPVIIFSGLSPQELDKYHTIPLKHRVTSVFSDEVTHLVSGVNKSGFCKRTIKFFQAMTHGKPIVKTSWLDRSITDSMWAAVDEHLVKGAIGFKKDAPKMALSQYKSGIPGLFTGLTFYVDKQLDCTPNREVITKLILAVNGTVINREPKSITPSKKRVYHVKPDFYLNTVPVIMITNDEKSSSQYVVQKHTWVLDCISNYEIGS